MAPSTRERVTDYQDGLRVKIPSPDRLNSMQMRNNVLTTMTLAWVLASWMGICETACAQAKPAEPSDEKPPAVAADHVRKARLGLALFKSDVKSLLRKHCVDCHGGKSTKGDFDLSTRKKLMESGYVEDTAADSYLMSLIRHEEEPAMPFKQPRLKDADIASIAKWLDLGAPYDAPLAEQSAKPEGPYVVTEEDRQFWSFQPLSKPKPPEISDRWIQNDIDRFILQQLKDARLNPNPTTDRRSLIRRATFDLTGLPPTPEEVDAFVADNDPKAYERLLDRLLQSPHYGERWARFWMDVTRFAESHGYEQDYDRPHAYHYRDFLIRAFNSDMPYDQFVRWQIAGDEFAPENPLALMATGFMGAGVFPTQLTEAEFESARYDELDDIVGTTGVTFLGLSIGCARCHDHKFDPIPSRDYYEMASVFRTAIRSEIELNLTPEENAQREEQFARKLKAIEQEEADYKGQQGSVAFKKWLQETSPPELSGPWKQLAVDRIATSSGTNYEAQDDGSWLAKGKIPPTDVVILEGSLNPGLWTGIRIEALTHPTLPRKGPGLAANGNFALGNIRLLISNAEDSDKPVELQLSGARATHQQDTGTLSVAASIDADPVSGWAVDKGGIGKDQAAVFQLAEPLTITDPSTLQVELRFEHPNQRHAMGRIRVSTTGLDNAPVETGLTGPPTDIVEVLRDSRNGSEVTSARREKAFQWFLSTQREWTQLQEKKAELKKKGSGATLTKVQVTSEGWPHMKHHADGRGYPHFYPDTYLLKRGDVQQKVEKVEAGYLKVLMPAKETAEQWSSSAPEGWSRTSFRRASLTNWMTDAERGAGHILARVIVNRLWQHHFGTGIVSSPNDFGFQGERPTHPELLDFLAQDLIDGGWKLKRIHRAMMMSATYRQNADFDEQRASIDRENRLYWRRAPRRLEAEAIRDSMLAVSGQLDPKMFGPGSRDANMRRRSIYFFIKRSQLIPMMVLFDWPEHLVSIGQRATTTVAPQALMFMNSPQGRKYADAFARRLQNEDRQQQIQNAYRYAFQRAPTTEELQLGTDFIAAQEALHKKSQSKNATHQALVDYCQALLGMNEFVYVD